VQRAGDGDSGNCLSGSGLSHFHQISASSGNGKGITTLRQQSLRREPKQAAGKRESLLLVLVGSCADGHQWIFHLALPFSFFEGGHLWKAW